MAAGRIPTTANSTITTKGDLFTYSTAPARLAVGTNATVLTADSTEATGLKWATPSSGGVVFLNRTTFSNVATVDIDYFSSSYFNYMVVIETISAATGTDDIWMRFRVGATTDASGMYYNATQRLTYAGAASTLLAGSAYQFPLFPDNSSTYGGTHAVLYFNGVGNSSEIASFHGTWECGDLASNGFTGGNCATSQTYTGIRLLSASTNITGAVSVYGLAKV